MAKVNLTVVKFRRENLAAPLVSLAKTRARVESPKLSADNGSNLPDWQCTPSRCLTCPLGGREVYASRQDFPSARGARS